jgi:hypothetical protein
MSYLALIWPYLILPLKFLTIQLLIDDEKDKFDVWKIVGAVSLIFSVILLWYTLQFLRGTLPSRNPLSVIDRGGEWKYFSMLFLIFVLRFGMNSGDSQRRIRDLFEVFLLLILIFNKSLNLNFWEQSLDNLHFEGFVWLLGVRCSWVLSDQVHYFRQYSHVILVIVLILFMRLAKNIRKIPIY